MEGIFWTIRNAEQLANLIQFESQMPFPFDAQVKPHNPDRSLDQNSMFYALYDQAGKQWDGEDKNTVRRYCKLHHGVPIALRDDEDLRGWYDKKLRAWTYEEKLEAMEFLPVTSNFSVKQGSEYIDRIIHDFADKGFLMTDPRGEA